MLPLICFLFWCTAYEDHCIFSQMHIADEYDSSWVTCFQEQAEILLGVSAQELGETKQENESKFESLLTRLDFKSFFMKLRIKMDRFNVSDFMN